MSFIENDCSTNEEAFCIAFDAESDSCVPNVCNRDREMHIMRFMQFTVLSAMKIPSFMIRDGKNTEEIVQASQKMSWWRDIATGNSSSPLEDLLLLFDKAEVILGYNCLSFDFPLIFRFYAMSKNSALQPRQRYIFHRCKTLDLMTRIRDVTGTFFKLDVVLSSNDLPTKSGSGADAPKLWESNKREDLQKYCLQDVEVTLRLALKEELTLENVTVKSQSYGLFSALGSSLVYNSRKRNRSVEKDEEFVII